MALHGEGMFRVQPLTSWPRRRETETEIETKTETERKQDNKTGAWGDSQLVKCLP